MAIYQWDNSHNTILRASSKDAGHMRRRFQFLALIAIAAGGGGAFRTSAQALPAGDPEPTGTEFGFQIFQQQCVRCHGNPDVKAPSPAALRQLSPEKITEALTTGLMQIQGRSLSATQKRRVAEALSARPLGTLESGDARQMPNHCLANPALTASTGPAWNGWGADLTNTRFQPAKAAGLTAEQVPRLRLKWAFGFPGGVSAYGQPTVGWGRVFVGSDNGYVYSLDAKSGCVFWSFQTKAAVRNAVSFGPVTGRGSTRYAAYFGDMRANMYAVDAASGALLWTNRVEEHFAARITAAAALYQGRLYVPVSSFEEFSASAPDYQCCTSRGSVVALDANNGKQIWKTYTIPEEPKPVRKNSKGTQLYAPSGASVWNTPTIDLQRRALYFGTGDSETEPAVPTSDSVMALDMDTGKMKWHYQAQASDTWLGGCDRPNKTENCPEVLGPDWDIGNSPILKTLSSKKRVLIAGTKNGDVFALDPDKNGALLWKISVAQPNTPDSGIVWGGASDERNAYYGLTSGGMVAVQLATGERVWFAPLKEPGSKTGNGAATSAIPGVVFGGGTDGKLHALSAADGKPLWEFDTAKEFTTVNKVRANGGSIVAPGPIVAGGMLFVGSGYSVIDQQPGNVLLAFSVD
jgi:polyvinyl alcohol dehydrogenase (cytochrome)